MPTPEEQVDQWFDPKKPSTTEVGTKRESDAHSLSVGPDGPLLLHDVALVEKIARFDRERVPERSPHAKGSGAFGEFVVTGDVSKYTKAKFLQPGTTTPMLARFSTVAGELGSPDSWRDVRGFALKFYTEDGNFDMVGNNTPVFFVRDPMKFPDFIHSQKRLPDSGLRSPNMQWDFWSLSPESAHQVAYLMGPRGLPKTWRNMNGYSSHTYMWVNEDGEKFWVKYHFLTDQGVENMSNEEAAKLAGEDADVHRRDLFDAIKDGNFPSWTLHVQIMPYEDAKTYRFNPFDLTKIWSKNDYPRIEVGRFTLNQNPINHYAQIEQAAFSPSNTVPGTGVSPDKMLLSRVFSYPDAQRNRVGTNFNQLPVNAPVVKTNNYDKEGHMQYHHTGAAPVYAPNSYGRAYQDTQGVVDNGWEADGELVRMAYTLHRDDDDFGQAHTLVREVYSEEERQELVNTVVDMLKSDLEEPVLSNVFAYWKNIDAEVGQAIEDGYRQG
ncbi:MULTISPECIES: catalase [Brevibacterium]|uniref:Catalase n=2 Tax=Brevibacterium casei TaxID=33889 RepID=K9AHS4_9MICO|nr:MULTISPECIES: catalase [Brevibacterium]NJE66536.1 catalase [Brevibacterium sp. LS14]SII76815.1 catalase [Mycobacteroides abscessus subsp. abscessus]EKU45666.1 catalase [Brevibacterium casei S18]KZE19766.1 catalase [Brevibacterium casei]MBE4695204.1 catalase [Brevibacterium casei]